MKFETVLREKLDEVMADETDAKLAAILHGSLYIFETLKKIINTKMTSICPSIASEAFTTVNELAEKIGVEDVKTESEETSGAV
jgi:hypothetical protein